ncbi:lysozyme inhibitor LprI family protein [Marilutibacter aestuarii]|uniref:DUF1311 domain-containing protein n=1 Tax=Marilutibacter aestuarii TaxID=1706195 RepID=A0A508AKQ4_9GAMM|nr:lysozyme inhibitor LprI family protein [Lysobacter aestuarii]TQD48268.1 DUF1311 domain-containing protein [Lysobacter aestuarii]
MRCVALVLMLLWVAPALAGRAEWASECDPQGNQMQIMACAYVEQIDADDELDAVYGAILDHLASDPLAIGKFKHAQRIWIRLRDADVDARFPLAEGEAHTRYGSSYFTRTALLRARFTRERTRYLREAWLDAPH